WLPNLNERTLVSSYVASIADVLEIYVLPILRQEGLNLNNTSLKQVAERTIDEWSCGHVTLTFNVHGHIQTGSIIGTPYPAQCHLRGAPLPIAGPAQIPNNGFYYGY